MLDFIGQKILLIAPGYHNYIYQIENALKKLGTSVDSYLENPSGIFFTNFYFNRWQKFSFLARIYDRKIILTNRKILNEIKDKRFDQVIIIKGDLLTHEFLLEIKKINSNARLILYQWDSLLNHNYLDKIKYFDKVFSFDYLDCEKHEEITYLPLFYTEEYEKISHLKISEYKNDLYFLGFNHSIRVQKLNDIINFCEENNLRYSFNIRTTISEKLKLVLQGSKIHCFFEPIKFGQFAEDYINSRAIIDISSPQQTGLPIRVIEAIGANKKIITTNYNIINEEIYDPQMIFIWGKDDLKKLKEFLIVDHNRKETNKYSIDSFVRTLLNSEAS